MTKSSVSGYVVPALAASASGTLCVGGRCAHVRDAAAYHDHNWGVWRDVTWEWGAARGSRSSILYGGVYQGESAGSPLFLTLVDSLGVQPDSPLQLRGLSRLTTGSRPARSPGAGEVRSRRQPAGGYRPPGGRVSADALATGMQIGGVRRAFLQMRGSFHLSGRVDGKAVADSGTGFFETYVRH